MKYIAGPHGLDSRLSGANFSLSSLSLSLSLSHTHTHTNINALWPPFLPFITHQKFLPSFFLSFLLYQFV